MIILKYAEKGSLRNNLYEVSQMKWEEKLNLLSCITSDLEAIHSQGIEHRDLHSGNILQDELDNAYTTDLGLTNTNNEVCGILPYMAPEVLQEKHILKQQIFISLWQKYLREEWLSMIMILIPNLR